MKHVKKKHKKTPSQALPPDPFSREDMFRRAVAYLNTGRVHEAAELLERIIEVEPENSQAHYNLGLARYYQESFAEAEACFLQAVRIDPANADAHYNLGLLCNQTNRQAEAAECYLAVLELNPGEADAHFNLGDVLKDLGMMDDAISCFQKALAINPRYASAYCNLGVVLHMQGREEEAIAAYNKAINLGDDSPANLHILNALTGVQTESPPEQYVTNLFDGYAQRFEKSLAAMEYEIPVLLRRALDTIPGPKHFARAVDLGCGTGLSGRSIREITGHLTGIDLSAEMLAIAREKGIYDTLHQEELVRFLVRTVMFFDLFLLTDVCIYLGSLDPLFTAIRQRSRPGTLVLFSIELCRQADFVLRTSGRYAQSRAYIERLAAKNDMLLDYRQAAGIRKEKGKWIDGEIYILRRV